MAACNLIITNVSDQHRQSCKRSECVQASIYVSMQAFLLHNAADRLALDSSETVSGSLVQLILKVHSQRRQTEQREAEGKLISFSHRHRHLPTQAVQFLDAAVASKQTSASISLTYSAADGSAPVLSEGSTGTR